MHALSSPTDQVTGSSSAHWVVEGIAVENLDCVWRAAWGYLRPAVQRFPNAPQHTETEVRVALDTEEAQLWIAWDLDERMMIGCAVTQVSIKDGVKLLEISLLGGTGFDRWGHAMWRLLSTWARSEGCTLALAIGRVGWARKFGFKVQGRMQDGRWFMTRPLVEH